MFKIKEEELNCIVHSMLHIASILKAIENGSLSSGQKQIIHGCETRLYEIREELLASVRENGNQK